jgi:hypothetical protein
MLWGILVIYFLGLMFIVGNKTTGYLVWIVPFFILNSIAVWQSLKWKTFAKIFFPLAYTYIFLVSIYISSYIIIDDDYHNEFLSDFKIFNAQYYHGGLIYGSSEIAFFYDFNNEIIQEDMLLGFKTGKKPEYVAVESRYRDWYKKWKEEKTEIGLYIDNLLSNKYSKVYEGKFYTFYEKNPE